MSIRRKVDPVLYMQAHIARLFMKQRNLTVNEFLELDRKADILNYLRIGYDIFHLMGDQGIIEELDSYIAAKQQE